MRRVQTAIALAASTLVACGGASSGDVVADRASSQTEPSVTMEPSPTVAPPQLDDLRLEVVGDEEVVFDWSEDACEPEHIPDLAVRAWRDASDRVHLLLPHDRTRAMVGPTLDDVTVDCTVLMSSTTDADPAAFADREWLAATHTVDGTTVYALVHNEYQGHRHPGVCPSGDYFTCLDTSVTLAVSEDGGRSFAPVAPSPDQLVATMPVAFDPTLGPSGTRSPSNIITGPDGSLHAFLNISQPGTQHQWVCTMRSEEVADPAAWRFWDGTGFAGRFTDPYVEPDGSACAPLDRDDIGASLSDSVVYIPSLETYMLVGLSADYLDGREVWGFYYAFSRDLVDFSRRRLLMEMPLPWTVADSGSDVSVLYPSILDPDSPSRNFETTDGSAFLYFTRNNAGHASLDRDLIRVAVALSVEE